METMLGVPTLTLIGRSRGGLSVGRDVANQRGIRCRRQQSTPTGGCKEKAASNRLIAWSSPGHLLRTNILSMRVDKSIAGEPGQMVGLQSPDSPESAYVRSSSANTRSAGSRDGDPVASKTNELSGRDGISRRVNRELTGYVQCSGLPALPPFGEHNDGGAQST